jgi:hypothetical protein
MDGLDMYERVGAPTDEDEEDQDRECESEACEEGKCVGMPDEEGPSWLLLEQLAAEGVPPVAMHRHGGGKQKDVRKFRGWHAVTSKRRQRYKQGMRVIT